jgi:hypothetical protein
MLTNYDWRYKYQLPSLPQQQSVLYFAFEDRIKNKTRGLTRHVYFIAQTLKVIIEI